MAANNIDKAQQRIEHVKRYMGWSEGDNADLVSMIMEGRGSVFNCALGLASYADASAVYAWFADHDLHAMKQWFYLTAKLHQFAYSVEVPWGSAGGQMLDLLYPLLSDHEGMVEWFAHFEAVFDMKRVENPKTHDFFAFQSFLALRGEWDRLRERCERVLADPPKSKDEQKYLIDHQFFLALTQGDIDKMQTVLQEIVTPKALRARGNAEGAFTRDLISSYAVIYAKIAWRNGYEVKVDSPFIPAEWLPVAPLAHYDNLYPFLK